MPICIPDGPSARESASSSFFTCAFPLAEPCSLTILLSSSGDPPRGGYTIAEDETTAVVYGMPVVTVRLEAVRESLPLPAIGPRVFDLVSCRT
jgi:CheB methylesterase